MKKRWSGPLFHSIEPDVYLVDTSAWINIDEREDSISAWSLVCRLLEIGRVVTCPQVLGELKNNPLYEKYLKQREAVLTAGIRTSGDAEYLACLGRIALAHPAMCKSRGEKEPADTYVVALAELDRYIVVVDETTRKKRNKKIPGVCDLRNIKWIPSDVFLSEAVKILETVDS